MHQSVKFKQRVAIGDGSWIGENACIIGASIGRNCVIGANAVVTRDIPDYCVAVGIPAAVIRRFDVTLQKWVAVASGKSAFGRQT
jgi:acetyltransferase-like isoleucine patch superfamily enzyme